MVIFLLLKYVISIKEMWSQVCIDVMQVPDITPVLYCVSFLVVILSSTLASWNPKGRRSASDVVTPIFNKRYNW